MFHTIKQGTLEYLTADALEGSVHCFSTRFGGVSTGDLASLNLGFGRGIRVPVRFEVFCPDPGRENRERKTSAGIPLRREDIDDQGEF